MIMYLKEKVKLENHSNYGDIATYVHHDCKNTYPITYVARLLVYICS